jgi:methylenetetrahydrofolate dehydrogenase (NADP+)/methenyltetrahydrofolate cyclohydrolase
MNGMSAFLLDGKKVADHIKNNIKTLLSKRSLQGHRPPGLAVVILGEDPSSHIYVNNKRKSCLEVGFESFAYNLPSNTHEDELIKLIESLNNRNDIDGILVQLPLPEHINTSKIIERISPAKDVDGFHPYNLGRLAQRNPLLRPCTPYGVMQLLKHYQLNPAGRNAVVVGASSIVGRPMALELLLAKATVTICHRFTQDLAEHIKTADFIVVATGKYNIIDTDWLNENQVVVDVGIHRHEDGSIHGDINFDKAKNIVKWITPVPGGVGPMTICSLLQNTLMAAGISTMD